MDSIQQAGIKKKSFELNYNGGQIWCEHLDGMRAYADEFISKFIKDKSAFSRPSVSSFMIINLDQTVITESIVDTIVKPISESDKAFRKIAFVGVNTRWHQPLGRIKKRGIAVHFLDDYEKADDITRFIWYGEDAEKAVYDSFPGYDGSGYLIFTPKASRKSKIVPPLTTALEK